MLTEILEILSRSGCDRVSFTRDESIRAVTISLHRDAPPLSADYCVSLKELEFGVGAAGLEAFAIDTLIAKFP